MPGSFCAKGRTAEVCLGSPGGPWVGYLVSYFRGLTLQKSHWNHWGYHLTKCDDPWGPRGFQGKVKARPVELAEAGIGEICVVRASAN